jgi:hypothetical protein
MLKNMTFMKMLEEKFNNFISMILFEKIKGISSPSPENQI